MREDRTTGPPQNIRIPRIAIAQSTNHLSGSNYLSPVSASLPRHTNVTSYSTGGTLTPSYIVDHLPSRRLSEIDNPLYLPNLISSRSTQQPIRDGYSTAPLRIRTDLNSTRYLNTVTDGRQLRRERAITSMDNRADYIRFSEYPATATAIGSAAILPRLHVESANPRPIDFSITPTTPIRENVRTEVVADSNEEVDALALFNNSALSYQRICFLFGRYPAVALTMVSTWMLWGRGQGLNTVNQNENVAYIVSFAAGVFILVSQTLLSPSHGNSYKTSKILANLYHFSNIIAILISMTSIVFAAISFQNVRATKNEQVYCDQRDPSYMNNELGICFTSSERFTFLSILIGASSLILILFLFSGIYGCVGQSLMKKKRQDEFRKYAEAHDNASFRF